MFYKDRSDLEFHIIQKHGEYKNHECEKCGKTFVTAWRLRKHVKIHLNKFTKVCRYFRNGIHCQFEELGCKFLHNSSENFVSDYKDKEATEEVNDSKTSDEDDDDSTVEGTNVDDQKLPFKTSTPKKIKLTCDKCGESSQCDECFVDTFIQNRKLKQTHDEMTMNV